MAGEDKTDGADPRNANARNRLEALKQRRAAGLGGPAVRAAPAGALRPGALGGAAGAGKRGGAAAALGGAGGGGEGQLGKAAGRLRAILSGPEQAGQRKALMRAIRVLTDTPDDGTGSVEGTPFTCAGVKRLVDALEERGRDASAQGAKVANAILRALTSEGKAGEGGGGETVHGVQVSRLRQLARAGEVAKARSQGGRGGGLF